MWQSVKILKVSNALTLKQIFLRTKTFFKKLEYHFLVQNTKTENASFSYKAATSEANLKTNRMVSEYKMDLSQRTDFCQQTTLFFWKFCFSLRTSYKELIWYTNEPNTHILTFRKRWILFDGAFSRSVSLNVFNKDTEIIEREIEYVKNWPLF